MSAAAAAAPLLELREVRLGSPDATAVLEFLREPSRRAITVRIQNVMAHADWVRWRMFAAFDRASGCPLALLVNWAHERIAIPSTLSAASDAEAFRALLRAEASQPPWREQEVWFWSLPLQLCEAVRQVAEPLGLTCVDHECYTYALDAARLPPDQGSEKELAAAGTDSAAAVRVAPLREEHAALVEANWLTGGDMPDRVGFVRYLLRSRPSSAVFLDGKPVAWAVQQVLGEVALVTALPEHRRRGFATLAVLDLSRKIVRAGLTPFCIILQGNEASVRMFTRAGFHRVDLMSWTQVLPRRQATQ